MYYIGVDIGGMSIKAGVVDAKGSILVKDSVPTKVDAKEEDIVVGTVEAIKKVIDKSGLKLNDFVGIGMGIPGTIDSQRGLIVYSNNIKIENVSIVEEVQKYINLPIKINNDANCAALGEVIFGNAKGKKDIIFITLGTGVGSGIIIDGKIFEGRGGAGAEAGHSVIKLKGADCTCGRKGCWEAYSSASALIRQTTKAIEKYPDSLMTKIAEEEGKVSGKTAFKAAKAGDKVGKRVANQYMKYISAGLINLVSLFRPEAVLIGGGVSNEGSYLIDFLQKEVTNNSYGGARNPKVSVEVAGLKNDAGILGAVSLLI